MQSEDRRAQKRRWYQDRRSNLAFMSLRRKLQREKMRNWRAQNAEQNRATARAWYAANREKARKTVSEWAKRNQEQRRLIIREQRKVRYSKDFSFRVLQSLRVRTRKALRGKVKSARTIELLGCTILELRAHLEALFRPGMDWDNYGPVWHIDHKRPCASFNLLDTAQQQECFNFKNLQPLFAEENLKKGASY